MLYCGKYGWAAAVMLLAQPCSIYAQKIAMDIEGVTTDPQAIERPSLIFQPTAADEADYDKYFYFHRSGIGFSEAYADVRECDALASGRGRPAGTSALTTQYAAQYGLAGAIGAPIGAAIGDAIMGSAKRRKIYRINMRNCMGFKGYQRYGLSKNLWETFHFEEGNGRKDEEVRQQALRKQAAVASGDRPAHRALSL